MFDSFYGAFFHARFLEQTTADEREATALNWNMMLYVALLLILVGLFLFSLLKRRMGEQGGHNEPSEPGRGAPAPQPDDRGEGE